MSSENENQLLLDVNLPINRTILSWLYVALEHLVPSGVTGLKLATAKYQFPRYYGNVI